MSSETEQFISPPMVSVNAIDDEDWMLEVYLEDIKDVEIIEKIKEKSIMIGMTLDPKTYIPYMILCAPDDKNFQRFYRVKMLIQGEEQNG